MMDSDNESKLWEYNTLPPNQEGDDTQEGAAPLSGQDHKGDVLRFGAGVNGGVQVNTGDMISGGYHAEYLDHNTEMITDDTVQEGDRLDSITSALKDQYPLDKLGEFPEYQLLMVDNQPPPSEKLRELLNGWAAAVEHRLRQRMIEREDEGVLTNEGLKRALRGVNPKEELATREYVNQLVAKENATTINYMIRLVAAAICILVLVFTYYHR